MHKILFIIQSYPSEKSANVLCDEKIIKQLLIEGIYEVHCMCFRYNGQKRYEIVDGIHVHRVDKGFWWSIFTWALHNENKYLSQMIYKIQRIFMRVRQLITIPFFPISDPIACLRAIFAAKKLQNEYKFDIIVSEYFGMETLLAGYWLKRENSSIKYVPIFWDALSGGLVPGYLSHKFALSRRERLEKDVFLMADMPIAMNAHKNHLCEKWNDTAVLQKIKFLDIPRFDPTYTKNQDNDISLYNESDINIVFAGNLGVRDPEYIFELLSMCNQNNVVVWFFTSRKFEDRINQISSRFKIKVVFKGYVEHEILESYLSNADIFLNLGVDTDCLIPSKIFEYMSYGKIILSTYINENDPCITYLENYPGCVMIRDGVLRGKVNDDVAVIELMLNHAKSYHFDSIKLEEMFYLSMPRAYCEAINSLIDNNKKY